MKHTLNMIIERLVFLGNSVISNAFNIVLIMSISLGLCLITGAIVLDNDQASKTHCPTCKCDVDRQAKSINGHVRKEYAIGESFPITDMDFYRKATKNESF